MAWYWILLLCIASFLLGVTVIQLWNFIGG